MPIWQQVAILSTLPVLDAGYATWAKGIGVSIPRGFAYALLDGGQEGPIACFSLHLKSNMNRSGTDVEDQKNIYKREAAAAQILAVVRKMRDWFQADRQPQDLSRKPCLGPQSCDSAAEVTWRR